MITSKALTEMGVDHFVVVEPDEVDKYEKAAKGLSCKILPLDMSFKGKYETCDKFGTTKSTGPGPARNFAWEHSISLGFSHHWVMDDNIKYFARLHSGARIRVKSSAIWQAMEDFTLRYCNVAMSGPNYSMFAFGASRIPPFITNTRIYSCNLIRNDVPFRWRGRYNEDTIISLDMLKAGWCTIQFNAFLQNKMGTQVLSGGNTGEFYHAEGSVKDGAKYSDTGTINKSKMVAEVHPDMAKVVWKFNRWHHTVNYRVFSNQKLIKHENSATPKKIADYGMRLAKKND
jgi:hypothetical protein